MNEEIIEQLQNMNKKNMDFADKWVMFQTPDKEFIPIVNEDLLIQYLKLQDSSVKEKYGNLTNMVIDLFSNVWVIKDIYGIELKVEIPNDLYEHVKEEIIKTKNK